MNKYRVFAGQYHIVEASESEGVEIIANVWVFARSEGEALEKAVKKIEKVSRGNIRKEDLEYLKAVNLGKVAE